MSKDLGQQELEQHDITQDTTETELDENRTINPSEYQEDVQFDDPDGDGIGDDVNDPDASVEQMLATYRAKRDGTTDSESEEEGDSEQDRTSTSSETPSEESPDDTTPPADDDDVPPPEEPSASDGDVGEEATTWDEELLEAAGISAEAASQHFKDNESLAAALRFQDEQALQAGRQALNQQQQQVHPAQSQQQEQQKFTAREWMELMARRQAERQAAAQQPQQQQPQQFKSPVDDLDPEEWGEDTVNLLKQLDTTYQQRFQTLQQQNQRLAQMHQKTQQDAIAAQQEAYLSEYDKKINSLEGYKEVFGDGTRHTLDPNGEAFANRARLNATMRALEVGRQQSGLSPLTQDQLFDRALRAEFPQQTEQAITTSVNEKVAKRLRGTVARPTTKHGSNLTPEQKAQKRVADAFAKKGISLHPDDEDIDGI